MSRRRQRQQAIKAQTEQQKELTEQRQEGKKEQATLQQAFNANDQLDRGWMREILDTEDLEELLQPWTIEKIQAMLNKQWILGNLTDAEAHDRIYWLDVQKQKIINEHPPEGSHVQGRLRAYLKDDASEARTALSSSEKLLVDELIETLKVRFGRGREGFERTQQNTSINRAETDRDENKSESSGWGLW